MSLNKVCLAGTESLQDVQSILVALEFRNEKFQDPVEIVYPVLSLCADPEMPALEPVHMDLVYGLGFTDCGNELTYLT